MRPIASPRCCCAECSFQICRGGRMADLTLHIGNKNYSSWSLRPWLALKQTGAPFTENLIPLSQSTSRAALDARSPSGKVPVLCHGALQLWESLAICEYL